MNEKGIAATALSIRSLVMDAIQKAKSGHPGIAMGAAELAAVLYGEILKHNPSDSKWADRDRFVLSAGHGSALLYAILHLSGYKVSIDDIKTFRQIGSKCAGHPEYGLTDGVECTTGPLGQGIAMSVGMAIAETMLAARFNTAKHTIVDHYTYSLVGEGCLMEGISSEASSLAGHLKLGKLIVFYDENKISIGGNTDITFTEDVVKRYEAYGWQVLQGSMYDVAQIVELTNKAKACKDKPSLIILKSIIGKGAPNEGSAGVHGAPLGVEGVAAAKKNLGLPVDKEFYVDPASTAYFAERKVALEKAENDWKKEFDAWSKENPELRKTWDDYFAGVPVAEIDEPVYKIGDKSATRDVSGKMLNVMAARYTNLVGGSADLESSNKTKLDNADGIYSAENRKGRTLFFGIREFAMSAICCGITLHGGLRAFGATFLVFVDYMRGSLRLAALQKINPIYILTHDSIYVGEDGPTHQPVETFAGLRAIPNVQFLRPGDPQESEVAWEMAMESKDHPVCLAFTRQGLATYEKYDKDWRKTARKGAYIVQEGTETPDITILATGSEVNMSLEAAKLVPNKNIRVVSVTDLVLFGKQDKDFQNKIIGKTKRVVTAEAGISMGWDRFATSHEDIFCIDRFGESGPAEKVAEYLGFTAEKLAELLKK